MARGKFLVGRRYKYSYDNRELVCTYAWDDGAQGVLKEANGTEYATMANDLYYTLLPNTVKKEGWINIYPNGKTSPCYWKTLDDAILMASENLITTIRIEWEEEVDG